MAKKNEQLQQENEELQLAKKAAKSELLQLEQKDEKAKNRLLNHAFPYHRSVFGLHSQERSMSKNENPHESRI